MEQSDIKSAYLSLGSNQGDRVKNLEDARLKISINPCIQITSLSSLYETEPVGYQEQEWFINQVLKVETTLSPLELLNVTQEIEKKLGRKRNIRWGPRTLDIDILFFEDSVLTTPDLTLPHPRLHERKFILVPLAEIAPSLIHPVLGESIINIVINTPDKNLVKKYRDV